MIVLKNHAGSSLLVAIGAADVQLQVLATDAAKFPALEFAGDVFPARIRDGAGNSEYVLATARDGSTITVLRGQEGTVARDFPAGASFELVVTGRAWDMLAENRWVRPKDGAGNVLLPTRIDAASFSLPGDHTASAVPNRAVRLHQSASESGYVASAAFAGGITTVAVANAVVDAGLALVEFGLEVEAAPKYGDAANADTLGGSTRAQVVAEAQAGTVANSTRLAGLTLAEVIAEALEGTCANSGMLGGKTLAEVLDEAAVRGVPVGGVVSFAVEAPPSGFLECNGAAISRATYAALFAAIGTAHGYGDNATTFNLPDYRGRFLRGWDHAAARDPDRASRTAMSTGGLAGDRVGSVQADEYKSHTHSGRNTAYGGNTIDGAWMYGATTGATGASGGNETRPINANIMFCIKY